MDTVYIQEMRRVSAELRNLAARAGRGEIQYQLNVLADDLYNFKIEGK